MPPMWWELVSESPEGQVWREMEGTGTGEPRERRRLQVPTGLVHALKSGHAFTVV